MYLSVVVLLIVAVVLSRILNIPIKQFSADPARTLSGHPFIGMVSHAGILLWSAVATICFLRLRCSSKMVSGNKCSSCFAQDLRR